MKPGVFSNVSFHSSHTTRFVRTPIVVIGILLGMLYRWVVYRRVK